MLFIPTLLAEISEEKKYLLVWGKINKPNM